MDAESILQENYRGARILLAEDNAINREVAGQLLQNAGMVEDIAENGLVAVDKVKAYDYDLVLMDVQMPGMDGLEATRLIRAIPGKESLPIPAMNANVFEEDRLAAIDAGMNSFVAKPVNPDKLFSELVKWLPQGHGDTYSVPRRDGIPGAQSIDFQRLPNIPGLDIHAGINRVGGGTSPSTFSYSKNLTGIMPGMLKKSE